MKEKRWKWWRRRGRSSEGEEMGVVMEERWGW